MTACGYPDDIYYFGRGIKQDYAKATTFYQQSCDGGYIKGCHSLAFAYGSNGTKPDYIKAIELFQKACDKGDMEGCYCLDFIYNT